LGFVKSEYDPPAIIRLPQRSLLANHLASTDDLTRTKTEHIPTKTNNTQKLVLI